VKFHHLSDGKYIKKLLWKDSCISMEKTNQRVTHRGKN